MKIGSGLCELRASAVKSQFLIWLRLCRAENLVVIHYPHEAEINQSCTTDVTSYPAGCLQVKQIRGAILAIITGHVMVKFVKSPLQSILTRLLR